MSCPTQLGPRYVVHNHLRHHAEHRQRVRLLERRRTGAVDRAIFAAGDAGYGERSAQPRDQLSQHILGSRRGRFCAFRGPHDNRTIRRPLLANGRRCIAVTRRHGAWRSPLRSRHPSDRVLARSWQNLVPDARRSRYRHGATS